MLELNMDLENISAFLANMRSFPVAAAILTLAVFAVIARITIGISRRLIRAIFAASQKRVQDKLIHIVRIPIGMVALLLGAIVIVQWLNPLPQYQYAMLGVLKTLILLVFLSTLNRFLDALFSLWRETPDVDETVLGRIEGVGKAIVIIASFGILLSIWKVDLAPLLASAGILGIVVAIAAQDSLSNLFGGVSLILDRPFKTGDYVVLESGERGKVIWLGVRSTRILTRDDVQISVPNSIMASTKIINESAPNPRFRVHIRVGIAYDSDIDLVEKTLLKIAEANPKISSSPEPRVRLREFGDFALIIELLCWATRPQDRGIVVHQLIETIYKSFKDNDISIPLPQHEIYMRQRPVTEPDPATSADTKSAAIMR